VTRDEVIAKLKKILEDGFEIDAKALTPAATFRGTLRLDSIDVLDLIEDVEKAFGISADISEYRDVHDIAKLADFILSRVRA